MHRGSGESWRRKETQGCPRGRSAVTAARLCATRELRSREGKKNQSLSKARGFLEMSLQSCCCAERGSGDRQCRARAKPERTPKRRRRGNPRSVLEVDLRGRKGEQGPPPRSSVSRDAASSARGAPQPSPFGVVDPNGVIQKSHGKLAGVGMPGEGTDGAASPGGRDRTW